jgi:hypothetical protein
VSSIIGAVQNYLCRKRWAARSRTLSELDVPLLRPAKRGYGETSERLPRRAFYGGGLGVCFFLLAPISQLPYPTRTSQLRYEGKV